MLIKQNVNKNVTKDLAVKDLKLKRITFIVQLWYFVQCV